MIRYLLLFILSTSTVLGATLTNVPISGLPSTNVINTTDIVPIVSQPGTASAVTMKVEWQDVLGAAILGWFSVDTLGDLQLVPPAITNVRAYTAGWLYAGDGQGRPYRWDPTSTDSPYDADGNETLSVVMPDSLTISDAGRWIETDF